MKESKREGDENNSVKKKEKGKEKELTIIDGRQSNISILGRSGSGLVF